MPTTPVGKGQPPAALHVAASGRTQRLVWKRGGATVGAKQVALPAADADVRVPLAEVVERE